MNEDFHIVDSAISKGPWQHGLLLFLIVYQMVDSPEILFSSLPGVPARYGKD
jgi:hypothetical protein